MIYLFFSANFTLIFKKVTLSTGVPLDFIAFMSTINHSINQSINQLINQSLTQSLSHSINQPFNQSVNQLITNQPIDQSCQLVCQSSNLKIIDQSIKQAEHAVLFKAHNVYLWRSLNRDWLYLYRQVGCSRMLILCCI